MTRAPWDDFDQYFRECGSTGCGHAFKIPTIDQLIEGTMRCPVCTADMDIDDDDVRLILAWLLARVERLERLQNPFAGIDL